jgi:hypothetical protein
LGSGTYDGPSEAGRSWGEGEHIRRPERCERGIWDRAKRENGVWWPPRKSDDPPADLSKDRINQKHSTDGALPRTTARRAKRENGGLGEDPPGKPMTHPQVLRTCPSTVCMVPIPPRIRIRPLNLLQSYLGYGVMRRHSSEATSEGHPPDPPGKKSRAKRARRNSISVPVSEAQSTSFNSKKKRIMWVDEEGGLRLNDDFLSDHNNLDEGI